MEFLLIQPVAQLLKKHPSIRLDVTGATFQRTVQMLRSGGIDAAVGFEAAFAEWPDLKSQRIFNDGRGVLFVRRGHPILEARRPTLKTLAKHEFVSPSDSRPYGAIIRALYEDQGIDWRKRIHVVDFFPMVKEIVAKTDAIGVIMSDVAERSASFRSQFVTLDTINPFPEPSPMCCAIRARWEVRPAVRAFMSILQATQSRNRR